MKRRRNPYFAMMGRGLGDVVNAASVQQLLVQAAARYGFDPSLILAQAQTESGFRNVTNPSTGACGVLQLLPSTAAQYGVSDCLNVAANIDAGVHYLSDLLNQFGDIAKALAAYDWGPGNLSKAISAWGDQWLAHAPAETQNYVAKIAGVTPPAPLTIDAGTGQPIEDSTPTPPATPASLPSLDLSSVPTPVLVAAGAALAVLALREFLND
jgi:soluble lytic murein transglycosylase-like protein